MNETLLDQYEAIVRRGDTLIISPWYNATENIFVKKVYERAHAQLQLVSCPFPVRDIYITHSQPSL